MKRLEAKGKAQLSRTSERGITLIELMIVLVVLGLLTAIAFPMYQDQMQRARRSDGQALLVDMAGRMERFYFDNTTYTTKLGALGYSADVDVPSAEQHYQGNVESPTAACPIANCYSLTAQPNPTGAQSDDTYCGTFTLTSRGERKKSGTGNIDRCW